MILVCKVFLRNSSSCVTAFEKIADHGGIGVDVRFSDHNLLCESPKLSTSQFHFCAKNCALPFHLNKHMKIDYDPCREPMKEQKKNYDDFCSSLSEFRCRKGAFKRRLISQRKSIREAYNEKKPIDLKVNKKIVHLANNIPHGPVYSEINLSYAGGALAFCKSSNDLCLLQSSSDSNELCITPLEYGTDSLFSHIPHKQYTISLKQEPVLQLESILADFCCVRQKNSFSLVNITRKESYSKSVKSSKLLYVAASPYNPLEILSVYGNGELKLTNMENRKTVWRVLKNEYADQFLKYCYWTCDFGSHPFSALCLNEKRLYSYDLRIKDFNKRELFSIENASSFVDEELFVQKILKDNPFQHLIGSSHHLIMCDERYPKQPVMYWNHMLKSKPLYCDIANLEGCDHSMALLGTQDSREIVTLSFKSVSEKVHPLSLSPPLLMSCPTDCLESLQLHCIPVNQRIFKRFSFPLTGICIVPHSDKTSFSVFQSTSMGDVFYQDYGTQFEKVEKTYRVTTGCVVTPPERILSRKDLQELMCSYVDEGASQRENLLSIKVDIASLLDFPRKISANCAMCRLSCASDKKALVFLDVCPTCGLESKQSEILCGSYTNSSTLIGCFPEKPCPFDYDVKDLAKFTDEYSRKILSVWTEEAENINLERSNLYSVEQMDVEESIPTPSQVSTYLPTSVEQSNNTFYSSTGNSLMDTVFSNYELQDYSQESLGDIIPPSQEIGPRLGETIYATPKAKLKKLKRTITAGF